MRREHASILTDVLTSLAQYLDQAPGKVHVTVLAARANLPHDRLKAYLGELSAIGLISDADGLTVTRKGRQFLDCYHAWLHVLHLYGLSGGASVVPPEAAPSPAAIGRPFALEEAVAPPAITP